MLSFLNFPFSYLYIWVHVLRNLRFYYYFIYVFPFFINLHPKTYFFYFYFYFPLFDEEKKRISNLIFSLDNKKINWYDPFLSDMLDLRKSTCMKEKLFPTQRKTKKFRVQYFDENGYKLDFPSKSFLILFLNVHMKSLNYSIVRLCFHSGKSLLSFTSSQCEYLMWHKIGNKTKNIFPLFAIHLIQL